MKRLQKFIWPILLVAFLTVSAILFKDQKIAADTNIVLDDKNSSIDNNNLNINSQQETINNSQSQVANNNSDSANPSIIRDSEYVIPILMYHHIRDFNDSSDKIGTNLSVSIIDFANELDLIEARGYQTITFDDIKSGNVPEKPIILTFDDGYDNFYQNAFPELQKRGMEAVAYIVVNYVGKESYMTSEQIVEIQSGGVEIGSHTLSHKNLSASTEDTARNEITGSKSSLEEISGKKVISFCYPLGEYNETTEALVREAGYDFAVVIKNRIATFEDPFALNRYRVNSGTSISSWIK